ncbi:hypothetical protein FJZ31_29180 [Candidatus Poribacteria bacterium]|nr:hypothetical protein [Candidatus Poribacteria bacterium]
MNTTIYQFYATIDEQKKWLVQILSAKDIWCLLWKPSDGYRYFPIGITELEKISFEAEHEDDLMLFLGCHGLTIEPVWLETPRGVRLDFIRSQALQLVPSLVAENTILLDGRLSVMRRGEYERAGVNPTKLFQWYRKIRQSFVALMSSNHILVQKTNDGKIKRWTDVGISPGAVLWYHEGHSLKQFPQSPVEFDIFSASNATPGVGFRISELRKIDTKISRSILSTSWKTTGKKSAN